jgi:S1-C subfamily serine protease
VVIGNPAFQPGAGGNDPPSNPSPAPVTGGPLPGVMDPADVARVKRSTVMIRVELPNGSGGEGSGFFAMGREMIVTNAHVLGMLSAESLPPSKLTVIVHSGEAGEFSVPGRVLGVDRQNDLAIVGISGVGRTLPPPLAVAHAEKLHETQKVYIFGYPLGSQLGRNLTVSESSVSSLGRDENRTLTQVQVNGGMHHGNSGGPVTDSRGNVVAVSVAGIRGTQIKFAIPAEFVHQAAVGRLAGEEVGNPYREGGKLYLPVVVKTLDPMQKLREVKVDVWAGRPGAPRLGEAGKTPQPHDSPRQTVVAQLRDNAYYAAVPIPVQEPGNVVWIQSWNGGERPVYGAAHPVPYNANMILERQAINLTYVPAQAERLRTVRLKNTTQISLVRGKDTISVSQNLDTMMLERQEGNPNRLPLPRDEPC